MLFSYRFADSSQQERWTRWYQTDNVRKLAAEVAIATKAGFGVDIRRFTFK